MSKTLIFSLIFATTAFAVITLILSFSQLKDKYHNVKFDSGDCNSNHVGPFRVSTSHDRYMECNWSKRTNAIRILYGILFFVLTGILVFSIMRKSRKLFFVISTIIFLDGILGFYSFISDARDSISNNDYCKNEFHLLSGEKTECHNSKYFATTSMNFFCSILIMITSILIFIFRNTLVQPKSF